MKNGRTRMSFMQLMVNVPLRLVSTNKTDPSTKRHNLKKGSVGGFHQYDYDRDVSFGSKGYVDFVMYVYYPLYRTPLFLSCSIQPFFSLSLSLFFIAFYPTPFFYVLTCKRHKDICNRFHVQRHSKLSIPMHRHLNSLLPWRQKSLHRHYNNSVVL